MRYLKSCGLIAMAAAAVMAFAATAFATIPTSPAGTVYTGTLAGTSEGHVVLHGGGGFVQLECNAAIEGKIEAHGAAVTGKGKATKWEYTNCTNGYSIENLTPGTFEIHTSGKGLGTITSTGTRGRVKTPMGVECIYETSNTHLGVVTDSSITGGKATIDISGTIPRVGGSFLCGSIGIVTGNAVVNTPSTIFID